MMYKQWFFHPEKEPLFAEVMDDDVHKLLNEGYTTRPVVSKNTARARQMIYHLTEEPKEIWLDELPSWLTAGWATSPEAFKTVNEIESLKQQISYHNAELEKCREKLMTIEPVKKKDRR
ncbi:MAG: hypothetical protein KGJ01_03340 [Patescibacteria group bacterium]|nr:hypothetical protein [Patescibacteria group bacterium]